MNQKVSVMDKFVQEKFDSYPVNVRAQLMQIRALIFELTNDRDIGEITETLKWGEPSYLSKKGSTVRMDWKSKKPDTFSVYFNCKTVLIETFKEIYHETFQFVGNREIVFLVTEKMPLLELKVCLSMSLRYHSIKHLSLLGA